ncbi:MAG: (2Fe-2S)-binding protein [Bacteroidetes bacterium QH_2_64_26]|nr:MAG: (2Fe-2S)-binding protein [Bacteroidetes bacterium QH_2_64_26]
MAQDTADQNDTPGPHRVRVHDGVTWHELALPDGTNLRRALLRHDLSPYTRWTRSLNCGGRGLCATCGVRLGDDAPPPTHWHDRLAAQYDYPRLSCQIAVDRPFTVYLLPDKRIWGAWATGARDDADGA